MTTAPPTLWLAPLKGLTDAVFRRTFAEHFNGFDRAMAPFVTAVAAERLTDAHVRDLLPGADGAIPLTPQILGNAAEHFVAVAARLHDLGYTEVNWNLGCPFRPVSKKRRGAGLLPFPEAVDEFLDRVVRALPMRLSVKMRLGRTTPDEIFKLLPVLDRYPLAQIVIHPRTARQMYGGRPDLDTFESCLALSRHRIVYNGDIVHVAGFKELQARFPAVDEWMIGRGALDRPVPPVRDQDRRRTRSGPGAAVQGLLRGPVRPHGRAAQRTGPPARPDEGLLDLFRSRLHGRRAAGQADPPHLPAAALHRHGRTLLPGRGGWRK